MFCILGGEGKKELHRLKNVSLRWRVGLGEDATPYSVMVSGLYKSC